MEGVMDFYPLHIITEDYDRFTEKELSELRESLRQRGILVPIVIWRDQIVDGRHRYKLACELGIQLLYRDITTTCPDEASMIAHVRALNEHRRERTSPLTNAEKQERVKRALKENPGLSDRQIADMIGVSPPTVAKYRAELERREKIYTSETRTDSLGRQQRSHKFRRNEDIPPEERAQMRAEVRGIAADMASGVLGIARGFSGGDIAAVARKDGVDVAIAVPEPPASRPLLGGSVDYKYRTLGPRENSEDASTPPTKARAKPEPEPEPEFNILVIARSIRRRTTDEQMVILCDWVIKKLTQLDARTEPAHTSEQSEAGGDTFPRFNVSRSLP
jgi:ParB/RepB/Spo0J family partition protein